MLGLYGPVFFTTIFGGVNTFDDLKKTTSTRWGTHELWQQLPLLEYTGPHLIELSFKMNFILPITTDPAGAMFLLEQMQYSATPYPLVIGLMPMGRGPSLFVMESLEENPKYFFRGGSIIGASVEVKLKEYPISFGLNNLLSALGGAFGSSTPTDVVGAALPAAVVSTEQAAAATASPVVANLPAPTNVAIASRL
jgi:phage protein U